MKTEARPGCRPLILATQGAEVGKSKVQGQHGWQNEFKAGLGNFVRACLKIKCKKRESWGCSPVTEHLSNMCEHTNTYMHTNTRAHTMETYRRDGLAKTEPTSEVTKSHNTDC